MRLHENRKLFEQSIRFTAQYRGIKDIYIEKDYWVTLALKAIFNSDASKYAVFKGGTALSKCYGIIDRFSEDIDIVVLNEDGDSGNKLKNKLKSISLAIEPVLPEISLEGVTNKLGMIRKTAHSYSKQFKGNYGQIRDVLILESSWLGCHEPYTSKELSSYIYNMMMSMGQQDLAKEYDLLPFQVRVLSVTRTFCEKLMSLVRFSHSKQAIEDLKLKIRHIYDLHQLLNLDEVAEFFDSSAFEEMLHKVGYDDVHGYKNGNEWLALHPIEAILFQDLENTWKHLKGVYFSSFSEMVYGTLASEEDILQTLYRIKERLKTIDWTIKPTNKS
ncbi:nucleotidyl transferase AbiEii/AbiGii toxin family protein [Croceimicrobium hydrocarbonivorans]|uniref:Nucleotidyl transferase AbiEii/AbiGii toxin family protein n=1 Tax=Croceimicrobium hydrocarbonivorans TaxID=2761580 RepID=A0A7H0VD54_9FLAO|nr:nucleotidyl transferase AbiEii/AbiGii toxin family protein [Croceimicrobium hydrocarbonivorans]QNR23652.1 nucleotidyl transferase AbiEii/AbiGii toxin family protein [Croceimicrobium hydrocarbonivorans]